MVFLAKRKRSACIRLGIRVTRKFRVVKNLVLKTTIRFLP
jgi:hypothetical protein